MEKLMYTFDQKQNLISKSCSLTDSNGLHISNTPCWFNYDYEYTTGRTIQEVGK